MKPITIVLLFLAGCAAVAQQAAGPLKQPTPEKIFAAYCTKCHSGITAPKGLDLTGYAGAKAGVVAGDAERSRIFKAVLGIGGYKQMPPFRHLTMEQVISLRRWIDAGADEKGYTEPFIMSTMTGIEPVDPCLVR